MSELYQLETIPFVNAWWQFWVMTIIGLFLVIVSVSIFIDWNKRNAGPEDPVDVLSIIAAFFVGLFLLYPSFSPFSQCAEDILGNIFAVIICLFGLISVVIAILMVLVNIVNHFRK